MDTFFSACNTGPGGAGWRVRVTGKLREDGLAVLAGISGRAALTALARELMTIRPHRDAAPDGVTVITDTGSTAAGYAAFTGGGLVPHTDGTAVPAPPQLLLLACVRPADEGGETLVADGARVAAALAVRHPGALRSLSVPGSAWFGTPADGYLGSVCEPAGPARVRLRLRLDNLARFSPDAACAVPTLREVISAHTTALRLGPGEGVVLCNTRWLHGREPYAGRRVMLRVLGDPLPGTGILPGFPQRRDAPRAAVPAGTAACAAREGQAR
jgi:Taurine catabolism dioxygenase TauD, TfdA family